MDYLKKNTKVYLLRIGTKKERLYKIGISTNAGRRISQLKHGKDINIKLLHSSYFLRRHEALYIEGILLNIVQPFLIVDKILSTGNTEIFKIIDEHTLTRVIQLLKKPRKYYFTLNP